MAHPRKTIPTVFKNIGIPTDLCVRMELELYSDLEGKIPLGAQQELFTKLLRRHFDELDALRGSFAKAMDGNFVPEEL